jgi:hypothetical protein
MHCYTKYNNVTRISDYRQGLYWLIGFIDHSQVVTTTKYTTLADQSTLNLLSVLSLVFTIRFLATDLSQSHCNYSICTVFNTHTKSSWHSLIPSTADSLNSDLRLSPTLSLLTQFLTTHYLWHFIFFWLDTPLELFWLPNTLSVIVGFSGMTSQKTRQLPSNGCPLLLRIRWNVFTWQRAVYQESVCAGKCLSSRFLAVGLYVTTLKFLLSELVDVRHPQCDVS